MTSRQEYGDVASYVKVQPMPSPRGVKENNEKSSQLSVSPAKIQIRLPEYNKSAAQPFGEMDWTVFAGYLSGRTELNHANSIVGAVVEIRKAYETQAHLLC